MRKLGVFIMAGVVISIGLTEASQRLIAQWQSAPARIVEALDRGVTQFIFETHASITLNELNGTPGSGSGGNLPVGKRSGNLWRSVRGVKDKPLGGFVGTTQGTTTAYARTILGPGQTTIRPVNAKKLWIPIGENVGPRGARYTPRQLFETFGDRVKIFTSKAGNTVVFVEEQDEAGKAAKYKRNVYGKGGKVTKLAGQAKGKFYFVLKDQVIVFGTDALAKGVERMGPRGVEILAQSLRSALPGGAA